MITKLELIEYLKHTPENTNYNILRSGLYNGSNKEIVDEFIEVLSRGNLSLAALQPYLAKLYEDDTTISPEPLPPFSINAQPDWNQNDSTAADYVKNRPFYTGDPVETVLVEESTVPFEDDGGMYMGQLESTFSATVGETYKVSWDGTTYECACVEASSIISIGNLSLVGAGSDTGEPFIMGVNNGIALDIYTADTASSHTISISGIVSPVVKIDEKYLPELPSMDKVNPTGTGAFSLNRKADTTIGKYSFAECRNTTASGYASHAEGTDTTASGENSHAEGGDTTASGYASHAEGVGTKASSNYQHVHGKYNIEDTSDTYAEIVGNGAAFEKSNAHTLDWYGNAWYAGTVEGKALILPSSTTDSTKKFKITVDDSGTISATEVTE